MQLRPPPPAAPIFYLYPSPFSEFFSANARKSLHSLSFPLLDVFLAGRAAAGPCRSLSYYDPFSRVPVFSDCGVGGTEDLSFFSSVHSRYFLICKGCLVFLSRSNTSWVFCFSFLRAEIGGLFIPFLLYRPRFCFPFSLEKGTLTSPFFLRGVFGSFLFAPDFPSRRNPYASLALLLSIFLFSNERVQRLFPDKGYTRPFLPRFPTRRNLYLTVFFYWRLRNLFFFKHGPPVLFLPQNLVLSFFKQKWAGMSLSTPPLFFSAGRVFSSVPQCLLFLFFLIF